MFHACGVVHARGLSDDREVHAWDKVAASGSLPTVIARVSTHRDVNCHQEDVIAVPSSVRAVA